MSDDSKVVSLAGFRSLRATPAEITEAVLQWAATFDEPSYQGGEARVCVEIGGMFFEVDRNNGRIIPKRPEGN